MLQAQGIVCTKGRSACCCGDQSIPKAICQFQSADKSSSKRRAARGSSLTPVWLVLLVTLRKLSDENIGRA